MVCQTHAEASSTFLSLVASRANEKLKDRSAYSKDLTASELVMAYNIPLKKFSTEAVLQFVALKGVFTPN